MRVIGTGLSDKGAIRQNNEDFFHVDNDINLYIVCDGVGGSNCGEIASKMAAETCAQFIKNNHKLIDDYYCTNDEKTVVSLMEHAISEACLKVYQESQRNIKYSGMATTLTALLFLNQKAVLGHVGDSRCYLLRNNQVHSVTEDHTLGEQLRERYAMPEKEILEKKLDHVLNRCIGHYQNVEIDTLFFDVLPGDQLILCSDGLHNYLTNSVLLLPMVEDLDQSVCLKKMIDYAIRCGGHDNITAVLVEIKLEESIYMGFGMEKSELLNDFSFLDRIYLFKNLNFIRMNRLLNKCESREYFKGETIISKGEDPGGIFIFFTGDIEIDNGEEKQSLLMDKSALINVDKTQKLSADDIFVDKTQKLSADDIFNTDKPRRLTRGDFFGHQSLMFNYTMDYTVKALKDSTMLFVSAQDYKRLCRNHPKFGVRLLENFIKGCSVSIS